jgi:hypothetical protein
VSISDPIAVYNAKNNLEAHLVRHFLDQNGIEAHATADESPAGQWMFGLLPEIHKPQVWVDRANVEPVRALLVDFERSKDAQRRAISAGAKVEATCEECGTTSHFPVSQNGTLQVCPQCGAYIDVGEPTSDEFDS